MTLTFTATPSDIYPKMSSIRAYSRFCDTVIRVEDQEFQCHRVLLASASQFFYAMFNGNFKECSSTDEVSLKNIDVDTFQTFVEFVYTGNITITAGNVFKLLTMGEYLSAPFIEKTCEIYLQANTPDDNVIVDILLYACNTGKGFLATIAYKIVARNFSRLSKLSKLLLVPFRVLGQILSFNELEMEDHDAILKFLSKWAKKSPDRKHLLPELLKEIDIIDGIRVTIPYLVELLLNESGPSEIETVGNLEVMNELTVLGHEDDVQDKIFRPLCQTTLEVYVKHLDFSISIYSFSGETGWKYVRNLFGSDKNRDINTLKSVSVNKRLHTLLQYYDVKNNLYQKIFSARSNFDDSRSISFPVPNVDVRCGTFSLAAIDSLMYLYVTDDRSSRFYEYDCITSYWHPCSALQTASTDLSNYSKACIASLNNLLYVFGGNTDEYVDGCKHVHFYDRRRGKWDRLPEMMNARLNAAACAYEGKLYISGGQGTRSVEVFDPVNGKWQLLHPLKNYKYEHAMVAYENYLWAFARDPNLSVSRYDPITNKWSEMMSFNDGAVLITGAIHSDEFIHGVVLDAVVREYF